MKNRKELKESNPGSTRSLSNDEPFGSAPTLFHFSHRFLAAVAPDINGVAGSRGSGPRSEQQSLRFHGIKPRTNNSWMLSEGLLSSGSQP